MNIFDLSLHDDVIKWKHFPRYWPFVRGIHRSPVNSPHKGQWRGALMFSLICVWINGWVNNSEAGDLRRYHAHYDVTVMAHCTHVILSHPQPRWMGNQQHKLVNWKLLLFLDRHIFILPEFPDLTSISQIMSRKSRKIWYDTLHG